MSLKLFSTQHPRRPLQREPGMQDFPTSPVSNGASSQIFFVLSALVHIAAIIALSSSFALARPRSNTPTIPAAQTAPPRPTVARMAIDIAPVKFCEMKIEKLVSPPAPQSSR